MFVRPGAEDDVVLFPPLFRLPSRPLVFYLKYSGCVIWNVQRAVLIQKSILQ